MWNVSTLTHSPPDSNLHITSQKTGCRGSCSTRVTVPVTPHGDARNSGYSPRLHEPADALRVAHLGDNDEDVLWQHLEDGSSVAAHLLLQLGDFDSDFVDAQLHHRQRG